MNKAIARAESELRDIALAYPGAYEEFPWGERAIKVQKKVFLFMRAGDEGLSLSTKLPESAREALLLPFTQPTGYGLGKSGWVTASFGPTATPPIAIVRAWIDESFRAVAPKKLVKNLSAPVDRGTGASTKPAATRSSKPRAKKRNTKKRSAKTRS